MRVAVLSFLNGLGPAAPAATSPRGPPPRYCSTHRETKKIAAFLANNLEKVVFRKRQFCFETSLELTQADTSGKPFVLCARSMPRLVIFQIVSFHASLRDEAACRSVEPKKKIKRLKSLTFPQKPRRLFSLLTMYNCN